MSNAAVVDLTEKVKEQKKNIERKTLNVKELAQVLGIGQTKARELCKTKGFPVIKIGNRYLVPITRLEEWLNNNIGKEF